MSSLFIAYALCDQGYLNPAIKGYVDIALSHTDLSDEQKSDVRNGLRLALDFNSSREAEEFYIKH